VDPELRVRFTSPHPKDFPDEVLRVIADRPNGGGLSRGLHSSTHCITPQRSWFISCYH
jgi:tRNA A37 methylthiotransferase MiaB